MSATKVFLFVVAGILILALVVGGTWALRYYTAETRGIISGEERIESAPSRIVRYEEFFSLCAQVQSQKAQLQAQKDRLNNDDLEDDYRQRIESNIAGLRGQIARTVNTYNSKARQDYTSGRFRDSDLPYQLSTEGETTCKH